MIEQLADRAAARDMNIMEYLYWRNDLRRDYQQAFDPPAPRPATAIGFGWLWPCLAGDRVSIGTRPREFYETPGAQL